MLWPHPLSILVLLANFPTIASRHLESLSDKGQCPPSLIPVPEKDLAPVFLPRLSRPPSTTFYLSLPSTEFQSLGLSRAFGALSRGSPIATMMRPFRPTVAALNLSTPDIIYSCELFPPPPMPLSFAVLGVFSAFPPPLAGRNKRSIFSVLKRVRPRAFPRTLQCPSAVPLFSISSKRFSRSFLLVLALVQDWPRPGNRREFLRPRDPQCLDGSLCAAPPLCIFVLFLKC